MEELQKSLTKALTLIDEAKYHVLARESVFNYPEYYNLGRKSVYMVCAQGHKMKDLLTAEYFSETGVCPICESYKEDR